MNRGYFAPKHEEIRRKHCYDMWMVYLWSPRQVRMAATWSSQDARQLTLHRASRSSLSKLTVPSVTTSCCKGWNVCEEISINHHMLLPICSFLLKKIVKKGRVKIHGSRRKRLVFVIVRKRTSIHPPTSSVPHFWEASTESASAQHL